MPENLPIILTGMPGSGKSSLGRRLAEIWGLAEGLRFIDLDAEISRTEKATIADIFKQKGEAYFRKAEARVFFDYAKNKDVKLISAGGGAVMTPAIADHVYTHCFSIFLDTSIDLLYERLKEDQSRPSLAEGDLRAKLAARYQDRVSTYRQADLVIKDDGQGLEAIAIELLNRLKSYEDLKYLALT